MLYTFYHNKKIINKSRKTQNYLSNTQKGKKRQTEEQELEETNRKQIMKWPIYTPTFQQVS